LYLPLKVLQRSAVKNYCKRKCLKEARQDIIALGTRKYNQQLAYYQMNLEKPELPFLPFITEIRVFMYIFKF
jgi:hypothetical protein